jgi:uncharacterized damage-inducible protein DinB
MPPYLVTELVFARSKFVECFTGLSAEDALRKVEPLNSLSWIVGHLATQEHAYWVMIAQGQNLYPDLYKSVGSGQPASNPPLGEMWAAWEDITRAADTFLNTLQASQLGEYMIYKGKPRPESIGTLLQRTVYHYWYHTGEANAIRSILGHTDLPEFVGEMAPDFYYPDHDQ